MKKSKFLFFVLGALVFSLAACNASNDKHQHTYSSSWSNDDTYHWHDATCGHDVVSGKESHTFNNVVTNPTYTSGGYTTHTCIVCGYSYTDSQTDQLVHHYESGWSHDESTHWHACTDIGYEDLKSGEESHTFNDVVTPASYSAGGYTTHTCTVCGYSYTDSQTDQLAHHYESGWSHDESTHWHACTDSGYEHLKSGEASHTFNDIVTPASYSAGGYTTHTCTVCGYSYTDSQTDQLAHHYESGWSYDESTHWHACTDVDYENLKSEETSHTFEEVVTDPTYDSDGYTTHTCTVCGYSYNDNLTERLKYTITWKNWDNSVLRVDKYYEGSMPSYDSTPTKDHDANYYYVFTGWSPSIMPVFSDMTYVAQYSRHERTSFEVTYNANGGTNAPSMQTKNKGVALTLSSAVPTRSGHKFAGWNNIYENTIYSAGSEFNLDRDVTLWAMWEEICSNCNGTGTTGHTDFCANCQGTGIRDIYSSCTGCSGSGYFYTYSCSNCGYTTGYTNSSTPPQNVCPMCRNGYLSRASKEACPVCSGQGKTYEGRYECPTCNGKGYIGEITTCSVCHGEKILHVESPQLASLEYNTIRVVEKDGYEYSLDGVNFQSSCVFTGLHSNTTYNVYQRVATHGDHPFGITSKPLVVTTPCVDNYSISYNLNGGTNDPSNPTTHNIESDEITLAEPTRIGYIFLGWTGSNGETPEKDVTIEAGNTQNLTYTANWLLITYYVTYELNGGTNDENNPSSFTVEDGYITLKSPTKDHYDFVGWKEDGKTVTSLNPSNPSNHSLEATWTPHNYSITYDYAGGSGSNPTTHNIESDDINLNNPTRDGYTFSGWTGSNGDTPDDDVTIEAGNTQDLSYTANWLLDNYEITYHLAGGTNHIKNPSTYTILDTITLKDASKEYYTFAGWYLEPEFVNKVTTLNGQHGNLDLYAKFVPDTFLLNLDCDGGTLSFNQFTIKLYYSEDLVDTFTVNDNSFNPYEHTRSYDQNQVFYGWYLDKNFTTPFNGYSINANEKELTLYARIRSVTSVYDYSMYIYPTPFKGTFSRTFYNGGIQTRDYIVIPGTYDSTFTLTYSTRSYYDYDNGKTYSGSFTILDYGPAWSQYTNSVSVTKSSSITLQAGHIYRLGCKNAEYVITGQRKSDSVSVSNQLEVEYDSNYNLPNCVKDGYDFMGWYDENNEPVHTTWDYSTNQTFHAEWSIHQYNINYVLNGGTNNSNNRTSFTKDETITLYNPTREGYTFGGWYTESSFTNKITSISGSSHRNYTLYAKWTPNNYTATLDYDGGELCPVLNYYSNGALVKSVDAFNGSTIDYFVPEAPGENLRFAGWYYDSNFTNKFVNNGNVTQDTNLYAKWVDIGDYEYRELGSGFNASINGVSYQYFTIISPITQTVTIHSESELDLYGTIYDANWNVAASNDDISDDDLDFSMTVTLEAGCVYYVAYKGNQTSTVGDCSIVMTGINSVSPQLTGVAFTTIETVKVTYDVAYSLPTPKRDGYIFVGWYDENGNPVDASSWNYTGSIIIYAHWIPAN